MKIHVDIVKIMLKAALYREEVEEKRQEFRDDIPIFDWDDQETK